MATGLYNWSQTPGSNATATYTWAEGMAPSSVNDSARGIMADVRKYTDDIAGAIVTGGTSTAYTVTSYSVYDTLAHMNGAMIAFTPHTTCGATVTLNVDSLGAKPLRTSTGVELQSGMLIAGTPYAVTYNNSDAVFYLHGFFANPYNVPLGSGLDYWGSSAPNSAFALAQGQAISRTTYATLFALTGTTYGSGDGSTTFNIPDKVGRVSAMLDAGSARLSSTYFGISPATLGNAGGGQSQTLIAGQLPTLTSVNASQAISVTSAATVLQAPTTVPVQQISSGANPYVNGSVATLTSTANNSISVTSSGTGGAGAGIATPHTIVQPTIICNYIIRII